MAVFFFFIKSYVNFKQNIYMRLRWYSKESFRNKYIDFIVQYGIVFDTIIVLPSWNGEKSQIFSHSQANLKEI